MNAVRGFGLLIGVLLTGIIIGNFGTLVACLIVGPLFALWLMLLDDRHSKKVHQEYYLDEVEYYYTDEYYYE